MPVLDDQERAIHRALFRSVSDLPQPWRWFLEKRSSSALLTLCVYVPALSTVPLIGWLAAQLELAEARATIAEQSRALTAQVERQQAYDAAAQRFLTAYAVASLAREFGDVPLAGLEDETPSGE